jgi:hypothetical protein
MEKKVTPELPKIKKMRNLFILIVPMISFPITMISIQYCLKTNFLLEFLDLSKSIPDVLNFENKISLLARIASWISIVLIFNVLSVILARASTQAVNPLKDQNNQIVNLMNKVLTNSVEQSLIFLPLLANWIINSSHTEADLKQALTLSIIWIIGRILFWLGYFLGYLMNFTVLRAYGFTPTITVSVILILRIAGINVL